MRFTKSAAALITAAIVMAGCSQKSTTVLTKSGLNPADFESEYNGAATGLYTLTNANGMEVCVTNFGGRIVSIMVPDRNGDFKDVVLGFDKVSDYFPENNASDFGASIGRYANRIGGATYTLDGETVVLPKNDGENCLHGGPRGWQYQVYEVVEVDAQHIKILRNSPAGDNDFPGNVMAYTTYTLNDDNSISIVYEATTDAPTVINMTNHSYFNLAGDPTKNVLGYKMVVNSSNYTPTDAALIPTGEIAPVAGTPMDFNEPKTIGDDINADFEALKLANGYDHNWCLDNNCDLSVLAASVMSPESGIVLDVYTNEPGIQIYTGNFLDGTVTGKKGIVYNQRAGICLESQHYPDSPNKPEWASTVLRPGEKYLSMCTFAFRVAE